MKIKRIFSALTFFGLLLSQQNVYPISNLAQIKYRDLSGPYITDKAIPGESYYYHIYETPKYGDVDIEYIAGDLPIIISVPHGGDLKPNECTNRPWWVNSNTDVYTVPLAYQLRDVIYEETGGYPHIIICRLDRIKVDMNRDQVSRWNDNDRVQIAWNDFHSFIDISKTTSVLQYGCGLYIDLHGHPGSRTIIGYGLSGSKLKKSADIINGMVDQSSIRDLFNNHNNANITFAELIRDEYSFGAMIEKYGKALGLTEYMLCVPRKDL